MSRTPPYQGYIGHMEVDAEAGLIHDEVVGLRDVITFQGETPAAADEPRANTGRRRPALRG